MENDLKLCPFCNAFASKHCSTNDEYRYYHYKIQCNGCDTRTGFFESLLEAIETWNQRA